MPLKLRLLAASSLALLMVRPGVAATRPRYGGVVRAETRTQVRSLDPVQEPYSPLAPLVFDTLVTLDSAARPQPSLAVSWTAESDRRWRFIFRRGVKFSDGSPLTTATIVASLHYANPDWNVRDVGDVVIIETDQPLPNLLAQLALPVNSIVARDGNTLLGTGSFTVADWQAGVRATLRARDDGWHARPFVDRIEFQFGRSLRDQSMDMELGRADLVELSPDEGNRAASSRRIVRSDPSVLYALRFSHTNPPTRDGRVREAVSLSIDRDAIANILLQRRGEPAGGLLPNWVTGYSFLFATQPRIARARQLRAEARAAMPMTLVYRTADPISRLIAERVALNAADSGITIRTAPDTQSIAVPDIELVAIRLASPDADTSLSVLSRTGMLALPFSPPVSEDAKDVYVAITAALKDTWAVPIAYAPATYGLGPNLANWAMSRTGDWKLEDVSVVEVRRP